MIQADELSPAELGEIVWLDKSGYTAGAIAGRLRLPKPTVQAVLRGKGIKK